MDFKGIDFFLVEGFEPQTLNCIIMYSRGLALPDFPEIFESPVSKWQKIRVKT